MAASYMDAMNKTRINRVESPFTETPSGADTVLISCNRSEDLGGIISVFTLYIKSYGNPPICSGRITFIIAFLIRE
ncbi:MAG: hypothetical protein H0U78_01065 [Rickettsiaceae bacterium]|nr:hypothetical protein [Rickettsiaceae bacterium]